jgi:predicted NUDIX family NTP pyrophosphohydrolase
VAKTSAGIILYRRRGSAIEVLLVHPGGPYWTGKDRAAWSIPKGELDAGEDALAAARREFAEETGLAPAGRFVALAPRRQPGGKVVHAFALEGDFDPARLRSNVFSMEWPPHSGRSAEFPEIDRAEWVPLDAAREKLHKCLAGFIDELAERLGAGPRPPTASPGARPGARRKR